MLVSDSISLKHIASTYSFKTWRISLQTWGSIRLSSNNRWLQGLIPNEWGSLTVLLSFVFPAFCACEIWQEIRFVLCLGCLYLRIPGIFKHAECQLYFRKRNSRYRQGYGEDLYQLTSPTLIERNWSRKVKATARTRVWLYGLRYSVGLAEIEIELGDELI